MSLVLQNFVLFQLGWLLCVMAGARPGMGWLGVLVVAVIALLHLLRAREVRREAMLIVSCLVIGGLWESSLTMAGVYQFPANPASTALAPAWLIAMWALFATTLNVSMRWLSGRYLLAAVFGAVGGPLAFYAGNRLGAITFSDTTLAMLLLAAGWAVLMPVLIYLAERFNGYRAVPHRQLGVEAA